MKARQLFRYKEAQDNLVVERPPGGLEMAMKRIEVEVLKSNASRGVTFSSDSARLLVATHESLNTHRLAQQLERNYKNVYTDVAALVELGLLGKDDQGTLMAPFDEIVIHAGIRDAA